MAARTFATTPASLISSELAARWGRPINLVPFETYLGRNQVFDVEDPAGVLKLFHHEADIRLRRERAAYRLLGEQKLPVPAVLDHGWFSDKTPWLFMQKMPGSRLEGLLPTLDDPSITALFHGLGTVIGAMHRTYVRNPTPFTHKSVAQRFTDARQRVLTRDFAKKSAYRAAASRIDALLSTVAGGTACLVHRDASSRNLLAQHDDGKWHLAALIDFELAILSDPMEDIAKIALKEFQRAPASRVAFLSAYLGPRHDDVTDLNDRFILHLLCLVFDIAKWAMDDDEQFFAEVTQVLEAVLENEPVFSLRVPERGL